MEEQHVPDWKPAPKNKLNNSSAEMSPKNIRKSQCSAYAYKCRK